MGVTGCDCGMDGRVEKHVGGCVFVFVIIVIIKLFYGPIPYYPCQYTSAFFSMFLG